MQEHIANNQWDEHGCFVYRVLISVTVRSEQNVGDDLKTKLSFKEGDLVSVDLIRPSRHPKSTNGPFLRLSDYSGWLFENEKGQKVMEKVAVKTGLWTMYVDNAPHGIQLRRHPFDKSPRVEPHVTYEPMQKIYCDRRITMPNGVSAYRVQGTVGWVFYKRIRENGSDIFMLLPESSVKKGLFVYKAQASLTARSYPSTEDSAKREANIHKDELVSCDVIYQSPYGTGTGAFVRLTDGSGWLRERISSDPDPCLQELPVEKGKFSLRVTHSAGIKLRRMPNDDVKQYQKIYKKGETVTCDYKVQASGVTFYRVEGTDGWVFDQRDGKPMMELFARSGDYEASLGSTKNAWNIEFVRGIAVASGLKEVQYNPESRVIAFRTEDGSRINIYYTTRTIGTVIDHPNQGKTQLFRRNCSDEELVNIMLDPRIHTGRGYMKRSHLGGKITPTKHGKGIILGEEDDLRNSMLVLDEEIEELATKRLAVQKSLRVFDDQRSKQAAKMKALQEEREQEITAAQEERRKEEEEKRRREETEEQRRRDLTCDKCSKTFVNKHARDQHYNSAHMFICNVCNRRFNSHHALRRHRGAVNH